MKTWPGLLAATLLALSVQAADFGAIAPSSLESRLGEAGLLVLDVRTPEEFAEGNVPGAINIPHDQVGARLAELAGAEDGEVVLYCRSGRRAGLAAGTLAEAGFKRLLHLEGDFPAWSAAGLPTETPAAPVATPTP